MSDISKEQIYLDRLKEHKKNLWGHFRDIVKYNCPCKRKNITDVQWRDHTNNGFHKIWNIIHSISFNYFDNPDENIMKQTHDFFNVEMIKITCQHCRRHYKKYLDKSDLENICKTKSSLIKWTIDLHNDVNKRKQKPELSYSEVYKLYDQVYEESNELSTKVVTVQELKTATVTSIKQK